VQFSSLRRSHRVAKKLANDLRHVIIEVAVAALLAAASLVACWGPATWASFIDPNTALRSE
jgi:hypothetical protein